MHTPSQKSVISAALQFDMHLICNSIVSNSTVATPAVAIHLMQHLGVHCSDMQGAKAHTVLSKVNNRSLHGSCKVGTDPISLLPAWLCCTVADTD